MSQPRPLLHLPISFTRAFVQVLKKRQRPVAENLASNSAAAAASAFIQSPHRQVRKASIVIVQAFRHLRPIIIVLRP